MKWNVRFLLVFIFSSIVYLIDIQAQTTFYVDGVKGSNNYSGKGGWKNAKKDLQNAIDAAGEGDRIWVRAGIYYPTAIPDSSNNLKKGLTYRDRCFHIPKYLEIFGGFEGNETELSQRNWEEHPTILSGDFGVTGTQEDNAYHVIIISGVRNARLDGFTVVNGYADGDNPVPLKVRGITQGFVKYYDVYDDKGGGVYIVNSPTQLENFSVKDCASDDKGGGMFVTQSVSTLKNVNIINNESEDAEGGGIYFERTKNTLNQCVIAYNRAYQGGGIFTLADTLNMYNSLILNNSAESAGGGIYSSVGTNVKFEGLTIWGNIVGFSGKGGGIYATQADVDIKNCIVQQNAINAVTSLKGADIDTLFLSGKLKINYSFTQEIWPGVSNSTTAVAFSNTENAIGPDNVWKTGDDGLIPQSTSAVIAQGIVSGNLQDDITGLSRGNTIDIGAYQYNECTVYNKILYVNVANSSSNQDGSSWQKAFSNLQDAFDIINKGCGSRVKEIWVAKGTYIPQKFFASTTLTEAEKSFFLLKDVKLYGGFDGTENNLGERDFRKNKTLLSGQLNDSISSLHVLIVSGLGVNSFLSGFYIENGIASSSSSRISGSRTIFDNNGGGLYCDSSFAYFSDIFISKNKAENGAGIFVKEGKPVWKKIEINHNHAFSEGGAIYLYSTNAGFFEITADSNTADLGAGIATYNCGFATFNKIILTNNKAIRNGGAYYGYVGTVRISGALFYRNEAGNGGGIFNNVHKLFAENIIFLENRAFAGGATFEVNGFPEYTNCNFIRNKADSLAGASYAQQFSATQLMNNIYFENSLKGNLLHPAADVFAESNVSKNFQNNLFQTAKSGTGNITGSPQFFNPNNYTGSDGVWFTEDDGMMLLKSSPCLGAGNSSIRPGQDITGRPLRSIVDMGAYMGYCGTGGDSILYVDAASINDNMDGRSWQTAYNDLQKALNATLFDCSEIKEIWVKEGTYFPSIIPDSLFNEQKGITMSPRFRTFFYKKDLKIYGGFEGIEKHLSERKPDLFPSILSGDIGVENDTSDNVYHILTLKGQIAGYSVLDGFTLSNANANRSGKHYLNDTIALVSDSSGAAIHAFFSGITIRNCVFKQNYAQSGAAIYCSRNTINIENVVFENNEAQYGGAILMLNENVYTLLNLTFRNNKAKLGGAMFTEGSLYELKNVIFEDNTANDGGAIYNQLSYPIKMTDVIFRKNKAIKGGALYDLNSRTYISNGLFLQNEATDSAGVIYVNQSDLYLYNTAFYSNKAGKFAGSIFQQQSPFIINLKIYNSIFFQNEVNGNVNGGDADVAFQPGKLFVTHTFSNTFTCDTCFSGDPGFSAVNLPEGDDGVFFTPDDGFSLQFSSPLINKAQWMNAPSKDICGYPKNIYFADVGPYKTSLCITHHYSERIYVNAAQTNLPADGKTWETAYTDLQQALDVANAACINIKEIWIAKGIYTPTHYPDSLYNALKDNIKSDAQKSFFLSGKIAIYGGFEGTETDISQRNLQVNRTELQGLYNGVADSSKKCGNIFLVCKADKVLLDAVDLKYASASYTKLIFNNEQFSNSIGGGLNVFKSDISITNAHISNINTGTGGISAHKSTLNLQRNVFSNNTATLRGAALDLDSSILISENNYYYRNIVTDRSLGSGGAIQLRVSQLKSNSDVWEENAAESGGAIGINMRSMANISNAVFHKNSASFTGGALSQNSGAKFVLENILFARNDAQEGGAIYAEDSIQGNGITFLSNRSRDVGAAIMLGSGARQGIKFMNTLFAFNNCPGTGKDFYRNVGITPDIQYSMLQESYPGTGNFIGLNEFRDTADLIGPDQIWRTHDDGANLSIGSEALNKGNALAPEKDIAGYSRKANSDVGAYEFSVCNDYEKATQLYVNVNNTSPVQDGLTWNTAFTKLQDAINITHLACVDIRDIWVAKGIYFPEYIPDEAANAAVGNTLSERRKTYWNTTPGLKLWGGFQPGDSLFSQRNPAENQVWIDGDIGLKDDNSDNSIHLFALVNLSDTTYIDGISFRNANANTGNNFIINGKVVPDNGAAFIVKNAAIQLTACEISGNSANEAAAIWGTNAHIQLNQVVLKDNKAALGGALSLHQSQLFADASEFSNNVARNAGGAIFNTDNSAATLHQCTFRANKAERGGSIDNSQQTNLTILNSRFIADSAHNGASINLEASTKLQAENTSFNQSINANGAIRSSSATLQLNGNTFSNNTSTENGAALNVFGDSYIELKNSTFNANTTTGKGGAIYLDYPKENSFVKACLFNDNSAQQSGGAMKISTKSDYFYFYDNIFTNNRAKTDGGAVLLENHAMAFVRCRFENNASTFGGAVYAMNAINWNSSFDTCYFITNTASQAGGAFYSPSRFNTRIHDSYFEGNSATNGGVYYAYANASYDIANCIFYQNIATEDGACFYHPAKSELHLKNSLMLENNARKGGVCYSESSAINYIVNTTFYKNNATESGGAVYGEYQVFNAIFNNIFRFNSIGGDTTSIFRNFNGFAGGVNYNMLDTSFLLSYLSNYPESDPDFLDESNYKGIDGIWRTADDGLVPQAFSIVKGKGIYYYSPLVQAPIYDLLNMPRNNIYDLGAYKSEPLGTLVRSEAIEILNVFPNPFSTFIQVNAQTPFSGNGLIQLIDATGRICFSRTLQLTGNTFSLTLPGNLVKGTYFLRIHTNNQEYSATLLKIN